MLPLRMTSCSAGKLSGSTPERDSGSDQLTAPGPDCLKPRPPRLGKRVGHHARLPATERSSNLSRAKTRHPSTIVNFIWDARPHHARPGPRHVP